MPMRPCFFCSSNFSKAVAIHDISSWHVERDGPNGPNLAIFMRNGSIVHLDRTDTDDGKDGFQIAERLVDAIKHLSL